MSWAFQPLSAAAAQLGAGGGGPTYTLAASAGSFTLNGQQAAPKAARRLTCGAGGLGVAGQAVQFGFPVRICAAGLGIFALTGQIAIFQNIAPRETAPTTRLAVQRAVLDKATAAVGPLGAQVFDSVPNDLPFPFVSMDTHQTLDNSSSETEGFIHLFYMSVWSDYRGRMQVEQMLGALWRTLHERNLSLENGRHVLCRVTEQNIRLDADGLTHQGSLVVRIQTNPF
jgi:hypothetical protein